MKLSFAVMIAILFLNHSFAEKTTQVSNSVLEPTQDSISKSNLYTLVEDTSDLPFLNPELADILTAKIELENDLQILLISDPKATESAAAVSVNSGSWNDPKAYPGMAHFCEHMLFMGTEKYPDTNIFSNEVSNFKGTTNAYTSATKTVYSFSCIEKGYLKILDIFAHFFIDPIFDESNIANELHAVDQEFALMKENDRWREFMVFKETSNPLHPNAQFSAGNASTLAKIPQEVLKQWHNNHYGADQIRVVLYSNLPLEILKQAAVESFSLVPKSLNAKKEISGDILSANQKGKKVSMQSLKDLSKLSISWEIPEKLSSSLSKPAELIAFSMEKGHEKNLCQFLKENQLADYVYIQVDDRFLSKNKFFEISVILTEKGLANTDQVIYHIFQGLNRVKEEHVSLELFEEKILQDKLRYQYQGRTNPYAFVNTIARDIFNEDLASFPRNTVLANHFDADECREVLDFLGPENAAFFFIGKQKNEVYDLQETWLKVPYRVDNISSQSMDLWAKAPLNEAILSPPVNPFICTNFSIQEDPDLGLLPILITQSEFGHGYYSRCPEFESPKAIIQLHISSPHLDGSATSEVLASIYLDHLTDRLLPVLKSASEAGLSAIFDVNKNKIHLTLTGFSEKLPCLLQRILQQMPLFDVTESQFAQYIEGHQKSYANGDKNLACKQAQELMISMINPWIHTSQESSRALEKISFEDFQKFHESLFEKNYIQGFFAGNISLQEAESCWLDVTHSISKAPFPKQEHLLPKTLFFKNDEGPHLISKQISLQGNSTVLLIDLGTMDFSRKAAQMLMSDAISEPFFDTLRTKQKTGYIAQTRDLESKQRLYQYFIVQSNSHTGDDLLHRFEMFLENFVDDFSNFVSVERFATLKESLISTMRNPPRNLFEKAQLLDRLAFSFDGDFSLMEKRIEAVESLSYEDFSDFVRDFLSRTNRKKIAFIYSGKTENPYLYTPLLNEDFSSIAEYKPAL